MKKPSKNAEKSIRNDKKQNLMKISQNLSVHLFCILCAFHMNEFHLNRNILWWTFFVEHFHCGIKTESIWDIPSYVLVMEKRKNVNNCGLVFLVQSWFVCKNTIAMHQGDFFHKWLNHSHLLRNKQNWDTYLHKTKILTPSRHQ